MTAKFHEATLRPRKGDSALCDEVKVIGDGTRSYVWIGKNDQCVAHFGGAGLLRKLAASIKKALGETNHD